MNQVRLAIAEFDMELLRAIDFRRNNPLEEDEEYKSDSIPPPLIMVNLKKSSRFLSSPPNHKLEPKYESLSGVMDGTTD